jgi:hypothetical protein
VLQAIATGQAGTAAPPRELSAAPFIMRVRLDDEGVAEQLPTGSVGTAAIYTDHVRASHIIRQVILRQIGKIRNLEKAGYAGRGIVSSISLTLSIRRYEYLCLGAGTQSTRHRLMAKLASLQPWRARCLSMAAWKRGRRRLN